jgi:peptidoglycan/LPS O-acetylase OafA/YrhL
MRWEDLLNAPMANLRDSNVWFSLGFSNLFVGDYLVGGLTMILVYALGGAEFEIAPLPRRLIVGTAQLSFGLYLVHYPLLRFFGFLLAGSGWLAVLISLGCALAFAAVCEPQKDCIRRFLDKSLARRPA